MTTNIYYLMRIRSVKKLMLLLSAKWIWKPKMYSVLRMLLGLIMLWGGGTGVGVAMFLASGGSLGNSKLIQMDI